MAVDCLDCRIISDRDVIRLDPHESAVLLVSLVDGEEAPTISALP